MLFLNPSASQFHTPTSLLCQITDRTIKSLFAKSLNQSAIPDCNARLFVEDTILDVLCHARARRKGGPRYDPTLTEEQKHAAANLILLCPTCHTLLLRCFVRQFFARSPKGMLQLCIVRNYSQ
jgi:hypothetical protein